jgi:hypothetical protein
MEKIKKILNRLL